MVYAIKILIASLIAVAASEAGKRLPSLGALIVALPLTSMLAMGFLYYDTRSPEKLTEFARAVPPLVVPSIAFFYAFAFLIDSHLGFVMAMLLSTAIMLSLYGLYVYFFVHKVI